MNIKLGCIIPLASLLMLPVIPPDTHAAVIQYTSVTTREMEMYFRANSHDAEDLMRTHTLSFGQHSDLVFDFVYTALPEFSGTKDSVDTELLKNHLRNLLNVPPLQNESKNLGSSPQLTPNDQSITYLAKTTVTDTREQIHTESDLETNGHTQDAPLLLGAGAKENSNQPLAGLISIVMKQPAVAYVVETLRNFKKAHIFAQLAIVLGILGAFGLVRWSMQVKINL